MSMADVKNGLYSIQIQMIDGARRGHATGVIVLLNGSILGGDTNFYYTDPTHSRTANGAAN